jgi:hypothetical protein
MDATERAAVALLVLAALALVAAVATAPYVAFSADVVHFLAAVCDAIARPVRAFWTWLASVA